MWILSSASPALPSRKKRARGRLVRILRIYIRMRLMVRIMRKSRQNIIIIRRGGRSVVDEALIRVRK